MSEVDVYIYIYICNIKSNIRRRVYHKNAQKSEGSFLLAHAIGKRFSHFFLRYSSFLGFFDAFKKKNY